jgi:hypothetical protein
MSSQRFLLMTAPFSTSDDLPGALLRYEGDVMVLVPIDPLGNGGKNSKEAVTTKTEGWRVEDSILYVNANDTARQTVLEQAGYHRLADDEANREDAKALNLQQGEFIVMGRHELLNEFSNR